MSFSAGAKQFSGIKTLKICWKISEYFSVLWDCAVNRLFIKAQYCCALASTRPPGSFTPSHPNSWSQPVPGSVNRWRRSSLDNSRTQYPTIRFFIFFSHCQLFNLIQTDSIINIVTSHHFIEGRSKQQKKQLWQWMRIWPMFTLNEELKMLLIPLDLQPILGMKALTDFFFLRQRF